MLACCCVDVHTYMSALPASRYLIVPTNIHIHPPQSSSIQLSSAQTSVQSNSTPRRSIHHFKPPSSTMKLTHQLISVALFLALGAQAAPSPPDQSNVAFGQGTYDMGNLFKRFQLCGYGTTSLALSLDVVRSNNTKVPGRHLQNPQVLLQHLPRRQMHQLVNQVELALGGKSST